MKKLLALVLALVMTLGLATVGTNAALKDFSDADSISADYEEAFAVMNAVGVFVGSDGKLNPAGNLTRAQAAKLIAYLDLGGDVAETLPAVQVFTDVPATHWAAKYVAYCYNAGIIQGIGDSKFNPDGDLTGYAFGAYLLAVLGYDRNIEGITGAEWQIKAASLMGTAGIASDIKKAGSAVLTREEGAQYCLDALQATMVKYDDKGTTVTTGDMTVQVGAKAANLRAANGATLNYNNATVSTDPSSQYLTLQLTEKLYPKLKLDEDGDDGFGRPANVWTLANKSVCTAVNETPVVTYTKNLNTSSGKDTILADLKNYNFKDSGTNNNKLTSLTTKPTAAITATEGGDLTVTTLQNIVDQLAALTGNGTLVEVYADSSRNVKTVVQVPYTVSKITSISTDSKGNVTYNISGLGAKVDYAEGSTSDDTIKLMGAVAKDDIITFAVNNAGTVWYVYPTTSVTGAQSAHTDTAITVAGTSYTLAKAVTDLLNGGTVADAPDTDFPNSTSNAAYYLDQYGFVVARGEVKDEIKYAYVEKIAGTDASGLSSKKVEAVLVFPDGSKQTVNVKSINGATISNTYMTTTAGGGTFAKLAPNTANDVSVSKTAETTGVFNQMVTYTVDSDNNYSLTYAQTARNAGNYVSESTTGNAIVTKGTPNIVGNAGNPGTTAKADNATVYVVKANNASGNAVYTAYTGYEAIPTIKKTTATLYAFYTTASDGSIEFVFIDATTANVGTTTKNLFYTASTTISTVKKESGSGNYYTVKGYLNGEEYTAKSEDPKLHGVGSAKGFYDLTLDGNDYVTNKAAHTFDYNAEVTDTIVSGVSKGTFDGLKWNDSTKVYTIDSDGIHAYTGLEGVQMVAVGDHYYADNVSNDSATDKITIKTMYVLKSVSNVISNGAYGDNTSGAENAVELALATQDSVTYDGALTIGADGDGMNIASGKTVTVTGDATITQAITGTGTLVVEGDATIKAAANVATTVTIVGTLTVNADPTFDKPVKAGAVSITKATTFADTLDVEGDLNIDTTEDVAFQGDVTVGGNMTLAGASGNTTIASGKTITVAGTFTATAARDLTIASGDSTKLTVGKFADAASVLYAAVDSIEVVDAQVNTFDFVTASTVAALKFDSNYETSGAFTLGKTDCAVTLADNITLKAAAATLGTTSTVTGSGATFNVYTITNGSSAGAAIANLKVPTVVIRNDVTLGASATLDKAVETVTIGGTLTAGTDQLKKTSGNTTQTLYVAKLNASDDLDDLWIPNIIITGDNSSLSAGVDLNETTTTGTVTSLTIAEGAKFKASTMDINKATLTVDGELELTGALTNENSKTISGAGTMTFASATEATAAHLGAITVENVVVKDGTGYSGAAINLNSAIKTLRVGTGLTLTNSSLTGGASDLVITLSDGSTTYYNLTTSGTGAINLGANQKLIVKTVADATTGAAIKVGTLEVKSASKSSVIDAIVADATAATGVKTLILAANTGTDYIANANAVNTAATLKYWATAGNSSDAGTAAISGTAGSYVVVAGTYNATSKTGVYYNNSGTATALGASGYVWVKAAS